ncbi:MAG: hypothetical protein MRY68_00290 [Sphingomonas aquatilis]|nr:hypothetical protein [Sphingomonas aquatilis]MCI4652586.1 hypothetical protein [Sphingomonas aquatilis]
MSVEIGDRARVQVLVVRRQAHDPRRWRACDDFLQAPFLGFQILHPRRQRAGGVLVFLDAGDELGDAGAGLRQTVLGLRALGVSGLRRGREFLLKQSGEARDERRGQQPLTDARQRAGFEFGGGDRAVGARSRAVPLAAPPAGAGGEERRAACSARDQPGQEVGGALRTCQGIAGQLELRVARGTCFGLPRLHTVPQILVDDAQLRLVSDDPFGFWIEARAAREASPLVGHLDPRPAVEDAAADVELVVEDAFTQRHVAGQCRGVPDAGIVLAAFAGTWGGDAVGVEGVADPLQAPALRVQAKDAPDEFGLLVVDRELVELATLRILASDRAAIAEHAAAGRAAARRLAAQATPRRIGDAHPLLLADDALEGEHEVVDLARHHRVHRHPVQPEQLDHVMQMLGVAAQPVDILDDEVADLTAGDELQDLL